MSTLAQPVDPLQPPQPTGRSPLLASVLIAVFVVPLSVAGVAVALADVARDLGVNPVGQEWTLNGFNVSFAASTLIWGWVADRIGRWWSFQIGGTVFIVASLASVLAPNYAILDAARVVAGLGAGAIFSVGSALLSIVFTGPERARVFSLLGASAGLSLAFGPMVCGVVSGQLSWRWIFALQGILLVTSVLLATGGRRLTRDEPRVHGAPLLGFRLIARPRFLGVSLVVAVASFAFASFVTYVPGLLQASRGFGPAGSGLFDMFMTIPTLVAPLAAWALAARGVGARVVLTVALGLMVAGSGALSLAAGSSVLLVAVFMVAVGVGFGLHAGLVDNEGLALAPPQDAGLAAGWINTLRISTEAVAVALFGAAFVPSIAGRDPVASFRAVGLVSAAIALVVAVVSVVLMWRRQQAGGLQMGELA